jgi:hypothetical protein
METLAADRSGNAIGFGGATEIRLHDRLGTGLVGPREARSGKRHPTPPGVLRQRQSQAARQLIDFMIRRAAVFLDTGVHKRPDR